MVLAIVHLVLRALTVPLSHAHLNVLITGSAVTVFANANLVGPGMIALFGPARTSALETVFAVTSPAIVRVDMLAMTAPFFNVLPTAMDKELATTELATASPNFVGRTAPSELAPVTAAMPDFARMACVIAILVMKDRIAQ